MQFPTVRKLLRRLAITLAVLAILVIGVAFTANYFLKQSGITYDSLYYDFPSTLTILNLKFDSEAVLVTAKYAHVNWRWKAVIEGKLSGKFLEAEDLFIRLKPDDPTDTSTFEFSDIPYIQFDEVKGSNIRYLDKDGLDSLIVELSSLYAQNFFLDNGIFTDSIAAKDGTFIMSFPDTTSSEYTGSALADMIHINANNLALANGHIQINYPDEQYDVKKVNVSLYGLGTDNPIEFKLNHLSLVYQDSIKLSSRGDEMSISPIGDVNLKQFSFSSPLLDLSVNKAEMTANDRYYASIKTTHINSDILRLFIDDFPIAAGTDMVFDGGIGWANDSIIFNHFEILLDKKTKTILDGFAIYGDSLVKSKMDILTFQSTLFELQRLFDLEKIEDQKDIDITSQFLVTGNLAQLNAIGNADLNQNKMGLNATYSQKPNSGVNVQLALTSMALNPNQIVTSAPEDLAITGVYFQVNTSLGASNQIENLTAGFACSNLKYGDYKITDLQVDVGMNSSLTMIKIKAKEQDFSLYAQTNEDVLNADSIHFTGDFNLDIPTVSDPMLTAGNAKAPIEGIFKNTDSALRFDIKFDSLVFASDSLENECLTQIGFSYVSDTAYGITLDLDVDNESIFNFIGDPKTFEWISEMEINTANHPYFDAELQLKLDSNLFKVLLGSPGSVDISNLQVTTTENRVELTLISPLIVYGEYLIKGTALNFSTNSKTYHGDLTVDSLENPYADTHNLKIKVASTDKHKIESDLYLVLTDFEESIDFGIQFIDSNETKILKFKDEQAIKFGSQNWDITENQGATFDSNWNVQKSSFIVSNESQQIAVTTENEIIDINVSRFQVGPLYTILSGDSVVNGLFDLRSEYNVKKASFEWDGNLDSLKIDTFSVGNLSSSGLVSASHFKSYQKLTNQYSELFINLEKDKKNPFQYDLNVKNFDLTSLNSLYELWGFNGKVEGVIDGKVRGEVADDITASGYINFNDVIVQQQELGMYLAIPRSKIIVEDKTLQFTNFLLMDIENKSLIINGSIPLQNNRPIKMQAKTDEFKLFEQENKNEDYWGNIDISSDVGIKGTLDKIAITGYLKLLNSSNIGYRYQSDVQINNLQDEIYFASFSDTSAQEIIEKNVPKETKIDWDLDVELDKTKLYVLLYEVSNDYVRLVANGNLKFKSGQGNTPEIFGEIESTSGSIFYDVPMVSNLDLKINYASVKFVGDPKNPIISFTGTETFRVSTKEISGQSSKKGTKVPVMVIAKVSESPIDEFELKFDLRSDNGEMGSFLDGLPPNTRETYAMNLLIFGSMKGATEGGNSTIQAVVSKLNEISRRNIQAADLAFYVDSENNSDPNKTQSVGSVGYDFSKRFFDDKVNVSVGGEVILAPSTADGRKLFNPLGNVEVDFQLNEEPDIKAFASKKDSYLGPIDGQVDKYSVGITFSKWFKNLFHKSKSKKEDE